MISSPAKLDPFEVIANVRLSFSAAGLFTVLATEYSEHAVSKFNFTVSAL
jgi:hypothetical protein